MSTSRSEIEKEWTAHGLLCRVLILDIGHRCGYVRLPEDHIFFGVDFGVIYDYAPQIEVHGGITFSDRFDEKINDWWIGYDCAHSGDRPELSKIKNEETRKVYEKFPQHGEIRSLEYCIEQCENLALQLSQITCLDV